MKHCVTDEYGHPIAFYDDGVHKNIPDEAFEISNKDWLECLENSGCRRFDEDGRLVECVRPSEPPVSPSDRVTARLVSDPVLDTLLDVVSEAMGVDRSDLEKRISERVEAE